MFLFQLLRRALRRLRKVFTNSLCKLLKSTFCKLLQSTLCKLLKSALCKLLKSTLCKLQKSTLFYSVRSTLCCDALLRFSSDFSNFNTTVSDKLLLGTSEEKDHFAFLTEGGQGYLRNNLYIQGVFHWYSLKS